MTVTAVTIIKTLTMPRIALTSCFGRRWLHQVESGSVAAPPRMAVWADVGVPVFATQVVGVAVAAWSVELNL